MTLTGGDRRAGPGGDLGDLLGAAWRELVPVLDEAPSVVAIFAGPDHQLAFLNAQGVTTFGSRQIGAPASQAFAEHPDYRHVLDQVRGTGRSLSLARSPITVVRQGGAPQTMIVDAVFSPVRERTGEVGGVFCHLVDVTHRHAEDERVRVAFALNQISLELSRSLDAARLVPTITRLIAGLFAGWAVLDLWQGDGALARMAMTHHDPAMSPVMDLLRGLPRLSGRANQSESNAARCARTGEVFVGCYVEADVIASASSRQHADLLRRLRPSWFMTVPVQVGPRRLGALSVVRAVGAAAFQPADRAVLEEFAERAAIALAHAHDYDEQRQAALTLQRNLLPDHPRSSGDLQIAVRYQAGGSGSEVGGDWYDTVPLERGSVGIAVGDVQGHDLTAAALMGQVRAIVHSHAHSGLPPARIAEEANAFLVGAGSERLVTMTYLQFYPHEHLAVGVRAGHLPALVVAPDGGTQLLHGRGGLPLAVDGAARWQEATFHLPPGSLVAVVTDGLVESSTRSFDEGLDELARLLASRVAEDVDVLADAVLEQLTSPAGRHDDVALVLLRLPPADDDRRRSVSRRLPAAPSSAPLLRRFASDVMAHWGVSGDAGETAALLATELVSNATRHSDDAIEMRLSLIDDRLRVSVFDDSHRLPTMSQAEPDQTSGRGLQLVDMLAAAWGVQSEDRGKVVWFELDVSAPEEPGEPGARG